ncbi:MAG: metalloregulator ArsR/SmtB family transcription factor [Glaciecola sp.]
MADIQANSKKAAALLKSMSNESRLLVLCHLGDNELSVTELNALIDLSQSSLSQHLAKLRQEGLVLTRRESQTIYYRIANPVALKLISILHQEFCAD